MIHPAFYWIGLYFLAGAIGFLVAGKGKAPEVQQARWLKFRMYIVVVLVTLVAILYVRPLLFAGIAAVAAAGIWEIRRAGQTLQPERSFLLPRALILFALVALGFGYYAWSNAPGQLVYSFFLVFAFDGFSQTSGQLFGKHHLFPTVSPNKTVEGLLGGAFVLLLSAVAFRHWTDYSLAEACWKGLLTIATAVSGDWLGSWYKRRCGIKDYSQLIPGHGGVIDRFNSWFLTGAVLGLLPH